MKDKIKETLFKKDSNDTMNKTIIIAEIGECFNGDLKRARKLIEIAKEAGCDIVKFQTLDYENISDDDPEREWLKRIALNPNKIRYLVNCAKDIKINIFFTPVNIKTAKWILNVGLSDIKIASNSIMNTELIKFINKHFNRVFISTGMASLVEIKEAVKNLNNVKELYIMHCISEYPTGPLLKKRGLRALDHKDVRLNMMSMLIKLFPQYKIGYSDHTAGILAPVVAVALGARVIEKHITLDKETPIKRYKTGRGYLGTDHILSLEPEELKEMVKNIREVEKMIGKWKWERSEGENILKEFLRKRFTGNNT